MENSKEIATREVSPFSFKVACQCARGELSVRSPNTKLGLRIRTTLMTFSVAALGYFGVAVPLASRVPANLMELKITYAQNEALSREEAAHGYADSETLTRGIRALHGEIVGDIFWALIGMYATVYAGIAGFKRLSKRKHDVCRLAASLPGSTYAFLRDNKARAADLENRCVDFDNRLKAFVDGKAAFTGPELEEQYGAAMAQFDEERLLLDAEASAYLDELRETVALDRRRLKFVDDCKRLTEIRQQLKGRVDAPLSTATRHVSQDIASVSLSQRLEREQTEIGMPQRFLTGRT